MLSISFSLFENKSCCKSLTFVTGLVLSLADSNVSMKAIILVAVCKEFQIPFISTYHTSGPLVHNKTLSS